MKLKKRLFWALGALALAGAIGGGIWYFSRSGGDPVSVYPFRNIGMTEYWGDSQESYGPVSADNIQTVFLSDTQTITEVMVEEGDSVQKGDLLLRFDTTLSEIQLERKRLAMEKEKLQLTQEEDRLKELRRTKPDDGYWPTEPEPTEPDYGSTLLTDCAFDNDPANTGRTEDTAIQIWLRTDAHIHSGILREAYDLACQRQAQEDLQPSNPSASPMEEFWNALTIPTTAPTEPATLPTEPVTAPAEPVTVPTAPTEPEAPAAEPVEQFYVIFRTSENDQAKSPILTWTGMKLFAEHAGADAVSFTFRYFQVYHSFDTDWHYQEELRNEIPEETVPPTEPPEPGSGYTEAELEKAIKAQIQTVKDQEFKVRLAEAEYKLMAAELSDGNIYAKTDGVVVSLLTEEEARSSRQPFLKVSGGGGYLIKGSISELEVESMAIGQEVTVNDWNTGNVYTGTVQEIGDFPASGNGWNGLGNPNATYYPFTVFVDGEADLQTGMYASITYSSAESTQGIYLENPFLRSEGSQSYVLVRGENDRLEKRYVTLGKSLWGSYTQILSGVTEEDYLAFPYGKEAKAGAPTQEGDLMDLYNY